MNNTFDNSYLKRGSYTLAIAVLVIAFSASIWAAQQPKEKAYVQSYYLTHEYSKGIFDPNLVCEDGYHMASIYELNHTTAMVYDTDKGFTHDDSGYGPPHAWGWVRSGWNENASTNCHNWTVDGSDTGLMAIPNLSASGGWGSITEACFHTHRYWCISDATP